MIVSNHLSYFDPPIVVISVNRPTGFIAKKELFQGRLLKPLINFFGAIEIDRGKPSLSSIRTIKQVLANGWCVGIFIEGTRNKTPGILGQPQLGAAYFAWQNRVKILPVGLLNTNKPWGRASVRFGRPIEPTRDIRETTWQVMASIAGLIGWALPNRLDEDLI